MELKLVKETALRLKRFRLSTKSARILLCLNCLVHSCWQDVKAWVGKTAKEVKGKINELASESDIQLTF